MVGIEKIPWVQAVEEGKVAGRKFIDKFGVNPAVTTASDPEDVWEYGGIYTFTADAGADYYISSSSALDTQECYFSVLTVDSNGNWNDELITQGLAGQTKTKLITNSGDKPVRIYRIQNNEESGNDFNGTVYVYEDTTVTAGVPQTASKVRAIVSDGNNQTLMAIYTIPTGHVGFLYEGEVGIDFTGTPGTGTHFARIQYKSRRYGKNFLVKKEVSLVTNGNSNYTDIRSRRDPIPAKTDIKIQVKEVSEDLGVWSTFTILLVDENELGSDFLDSIGQIKRV